MVQEKITVHVRQRKRYGWIKYIQREREKSCLQKKFERKNGMQMQKRII